MRRLTISIAAGCTIALTASTAFGQPLLPINEIGCKDSKGTYRIADYEDKVDARVCEIGDDVEISFEPGALKEWQNGDSKRKFSQLVLGIEGRKITRSNAFRNPSPDKLIFRLVRDRSDAKNFSAWKEVLPKTTLWDSQGKIISVINKNNKELGSAEIGLRVASRELIIAMGVLSLVVLLALGVLASKSDLLKEIGAIETGSRRPYSLAMTQMTWWFALVFVGFIYLAVVLGSIDVFSTGALGLIGISATTGVFATAIGGAKRTEEASRRQQLLKEKHDLENENTKILQSSDLSGGTAEALESVNPKFAENLRLLEKLELDLKATTVDPATRSATGRFGFFWDLVSSDGSISLPRFQMIAWTLAFGFLFITSVITSLEMPDYSATALGLLGLSSGTYVGFKFPSKDGK